MLGFRERQSPVADNICSVGAPLGRVSQRLGSGLWMGITRTVAVLEASGNMDRLSSRAKWTTANSPACRRTALMNDTNVTIPAALSACVALEFQTLVASESLGYGLKGHISA